MPHPRGFTLVYDERAAQAGGEVDGVAGLGRVGGHYQQKNDCDCRQGYDRRRGQPAAGARGARRLGRQGGLLAVDGGEEVRVDRLRAVERGAAAAWISGARPPSLVWSRDGVRMGSDPLPSGGALGVRSQHAMARRT